MVAGGRRPLMRSQQKRVCHRFEGLILWKRELISGIYAGAGDRKTLTIYAGLREMIFLLAK